MHPFRAASRACPLLAAAFLFAASGLGCAQPPPTTNRQPTSIAAPAKPAPPAADTHRYMVTDTRIRMTYSDPKTGKLLWKAKVGSGEAQPQSMDSAGMIGTLHDVDGVVYQSGAPADRMIAKTVTIDQTNRIITATGRVHVISLTQPDTDILCDKVIWYAATNKLIGRGHVVLHKGSFTQTGPSFAADTRLREVRMPDPSAPGPGRVHAED